MKWRACLRAVFSAMALAAASAAPAQSNNECDQPGEAPDVITGALESPIRHGAAGGITAFSIGTTSCNVGTCWAKWIANTSEHPVIGQNLFRLKDGRFEQIGQSWLKHSHAAFQMTFCSTACMSSGTITRLGVNCSDPYSAGLNGSQDQLGPKDEVNAFTGEFAFPPRDFGTFGDAIYKRLQVHTTDLDPALNSGALYFAEGQYVAADDAQGDNGANNAAYRRVVVTGSNGNFNLAYLGFSFSQTAAISAWKAADPAVTETAASVPGEGAFRVAAKATDLGGGWWHYEYAVHNLNSHRSGGSFAVPLPASAQVQNLGFHDVDYHSGDPTAGTDWSVTVEASPPAIVWRTEDLAANVNANALRWGTLYNFRFDTNVAPTSAPITLGLWRPGTPDAIDIATVAPQVCNANATCDVGETCNRCPLECGAPGPGNTCCGNGICQPTGESACVCPEDCGAATQSELACGNAQDDDCDGQLDCNDTDCCSAGICLAGDNDGDQHPPACDCDDENNQAWATPGEATGFIVAKGTSGETLLEWSPPSFQGAATLQYETLRTLTASDFNAAADCLTSPDPTSPANVDAADPVEGACFYYLVRATNACPSGDGSLGTDSSGQPRTGRPCP